jgi:exodeoxyribonuclease VII large subunit
LAVLARRWHQQGIERPLGLLHRAMGRQAQRVDELEFRLRDLLRSLLERHARAQRTLAARLNYFDLRPRFAADRRRLDQAHAAAAQSLRWQLARRRGAVEQLSAKLSQLSPLLILDRGYAIVTNLSGSIVKDSAAAPPASSIEVRLARGRLNATVSNHHPGAPRQWPS